jgi:hypothetical protein
LNAPVTQSVGDVFTFVQGVSNKLLNQTAGFDIPHVAESQ